MKNANVLSWGRPEGRTRLPTRYRASACSPRTIPPYRFPQSRLKVSDLRNCSTMQQDTKLFFIFVCCMHHKRGMESAAIILFNYALPNFNSRHVAACTFLTKNLPGASRDGRKHPMEALTSQQLAELAESIHLHSIWWTHNLIALCNFSNINYWP